MSGLDALPAVPASALPADVRTGSADEKKAYRAALGFERVLLQSVVKDMTKAGGLDDSPYASAIQDSFSDALVAGGGIGLGEQLYHAMRPTQSTTP
jgi:Rod binding domain-containing protein